MTTFVALVIAMWIVASAASILLWLAVKNLGTWLHRASIRWQARREVRRDRRAFRKCRCVLRDEVTSSCNCGGWHPAHEFGCPAEAVCPGPNDYWHAEARR
jgi:hypothetical protein